MLPSWANDTVTRMRPALVDGGHGDLVPDLTNLDDGDSLVISGCSVQPGVNTENRDRRDAVRVALSVYAPSGVDVTAGDVIRWGGVTYRVISQPDAWRSPTGAASHLQIDLEVWEG
jgi:hypothetical protein